MESQTTTTTTQFPVVDFSGLKMSMAGTELAWAATRAKVMEALDTVGFFAVMFDDISDELLDELFGPAAKSLFSIPNELRVKMASENEISMMKRVAPRYDSVFIDEAQSPDAVRAFTDIMWPQGYTSFSDTLWSMTTQFSELELMVKRMIIEGLGVGEHLGSFVDSTKQVLMVLEYGAPLDQDTMITLPKHKDPCLMSLTYQHEREGLELLTKSGEWLPAPPKTFTCVTGDSFYALSNGRIKSVEHRVRMRNNETRYAIDIVSQFKEGCRIKVPTELVSDENPMPFNSFEYLSYLLFLYSEKGDKANDPVKAYCGLNVDEVKV